MILADKYSPKSLSEVKGNPNAINELIDFIKNFKGRSKKSIILAGPTGTGKTCSVYAFAYENNYEVLELNASDFRNKKKLEEFMNNAINYQSLFMKNKIILIDEIDGLSGTKDRGGIQALTKVIEKTNFPIIMTANDLSKDKLSSLVKKTDVIEYNELDSNEIFSRLLEVTEKEKFDVSDFILRSISSRSGGDLRGALNDLQLLTSIKIKEEDLELIGHRKKVEEIDNILRLIFKSKDIKVLNRNIEDINLDTLKDYISENVINEYDKDYIDKSFTYLSKSDIFKGRIIRWQYWRFLVYQKLFLIAVALAKEIKSSKIIRYKRPRRGLYIWQANMRNLRKRSISGKLAEYYKVSYKKAFRDIFPDVKFLIKNNRIQEELDLNEDEIDWINNKL